MMRAMVLEKPGTELRLVETPQPAPKDQQVVIKVRAVAFLPVAAALRRSYFRPEFQDGLPVSRPGMTYVHEFKYDKTAFRGAEEEKSDEDERLPNPNEMDSKSSGALEYPQ